MKIHPFQSNIWSKNICFGILMLFAILVIAPNSSYAQITNGTDLSTVKIDDLTDEQILNYIKRAEERGVDRTQIESLARQQGLPEAEITKLKTRILNLSVGGAATATSASVDIPSRPASGLQGPDSFGLSVNDQLSDLTPQEKRVFGFGLFRKSDLSFAPNLSLPTPVDYQLGPGDELIVDFWGTTQQFFRFVVSREGTVRPDKLGPIYVNGLTIEKATRRIVDRFAQIYSGLKEKDGKGPTIFHQVSLGNIRTINVEVIGSAEQPGVYALPSLATVYTALHAAGGPSLNGTLRDIRVIRNNKLLTTLDVYSFLTQGIRSGDERLKNGDVIIIPPYKSRIDLVGEVKVPGVYELKEGESVQDVLDFANGFNDVAYKGVVTLKRNGDMERELLDISADDFEKFQPQNGDRLEVGKIMDRFSNRIVINGAIFRKGEYQLTDGLTLKTLIEKAGGPRPDAFMGRATIYRVGDDYSQAVIPFNLEEILNGSATDIALKNEDIITISSLYDLGEEFYVKISGEVLESGVYPYFNQMTIKDLIVLAGGLKESASGAFVEISRRNTEGSINSTAKIISLSIDKDLSLSDEEAQLMIEPFDQVYIRISPGYSIQEQLTVEGEVLAPGPYSISRRDERISDIITRAKGLTPYAYLEGAILIRQEEFVKNQSQGIISQEELKELRKKILNGKSQLKNVEASELLGRVDKLSAQIERANSQDLQGASFKQGLIESLEEKDSLVQDVGQGNKTLVAIDLNEIMKAPGSKYDLIVKPGDIISIPGELETVKITGEVTAPVNLRYDPSYSFKDYINSSGGFLASARKGRSYVQYPNGESKGVRRFLFFKVYPKILPGSTLIVSKKPEREPLNIQAILATASSLATLALVVDRLSN